MHRRFSSDQHRCSVDTVLSHQSRKYSGRSLVRSHRMRSKLMLMGSFCRSLRKTCMLLEAFRRLDTAYK